VRLTKEAIEHAKLPKPGRKERFLRDDLVQGLGVRVTANGKKSFVFEARIKGRPRRLTIGPWPDLNVALARQKAMEIRTAVAKGEDPHAQRQAERNESNFGALRKRYLEEYSKVHKRSWVRDERRLERCKAWDRRRLSDISADDVLKLQYRIAEQHGRIEANRSLELLRGVFNKAQYWKLAESNPALGFERFKEVRRDRFLSDDELRRLNTALIEEPEPWRSFFPLLLLLGTRRSELAGASWNEVDLKAGTMRLIRTKSGEPRLAPLPTAAIEILRKLPSFGKSDYLFPSHGRTGHLVEVKSAWARLCDKAQLKDVTIHDLRRTVGSRMAMAGVNLPTIGRVLGHLNLNATQIYARLDIEAARRALEANAASLPLSLPALGAGK
jgi:integrase